MAGRTYSLTEAASILGKHRNTVAKWLEQGCPAVTRADRARGVEWELSIPNIIDWLVSRAVEDAVASGGGDVSRISRDEAERRKAIAQAVREEVNTAELLDEVVNRHDAVADIAAFAVALRTGMANVCGKVAGRAATMTSAAEIQEFLEAETNKAFTEAQEELADRWADAEPSGS